MEIDASVWTYTQQDAYMVDAFPVVMCLKAAKASQAKDDD